MNTQRTTQEILPKLALSMVLILGTSGSFSRESEAPVQPMILPDMAAESGAWNVLGDQIAPATSRYIVRGEDLDTLAIAIEKMGGTVTAELEIISSLGALLTEDQHTMLAASSAVTSIFEDHAVRLQGAKADKQAACTKNPGTYASQITQADLLHASGVDGSGITIAFVDSGIDTQSSTLIKDNGKSRLLGAYSLLGSPEDSSGHGTHLVSVATQANAGPGICGSDSKLGIAPGADVVSVRAFDEMGDGTYLNVVQALDLVLDLKDVHDIRVVNLSFSSAPRSAYWEDPVNQAVMRLWAEGLVVVTSAGNFGPDPMSVTVPGNVPYVITAGAMTDSYTKTQSDDRVASFSGAGPTHEGFIKPDLVAPGGHLLGAVGQDKQMAMDLADFQDPAHPDFLMASGTSQASAVVSGGAALLLEIDPLLSNDDVKCLLMGGARPALQSDGEPIYSPFRQGAGLLSLHGAINATLKNCANDSLDINAELDLGAHPLGPVTANANDEFEIVRPDGSVWGEGRVWNKGSFWNEVQGPVCNPDKGSVWNEVQGPVCNPDKGSVWNEVQGPVCNPDKGSFWNEVQGPVCNPDKGSVWNEVQGPVCNPDKGSFWNEVQGPVCNPDKGSVWNEVQAPACNPDKGSFWNEVQGPVCDPDKGSVWNEVQGPACNPDKGSVWNEVQGPVCNPDKGSVWNEVQGPACNPDKGSAWNEVQGPVCTPDKRRSNWIEGSLWNDGTMWDGGSVWEQGSMWRTGWKENVIWNESAMPTGLNILKEQE